MNCFELLSLNNLFSIFCTLPIKENIKDYAEKLDLSIDHKFDLITSKFDTIKKNDIIVDFGCGTAKLTNKIAKQYNQAIVFGVENNDNMYEIAKNNCKKVNLVKASAIDKKFVNNTVKIFYISSCCHEVKTFCPEGSIELMFNNIFNALEENGQLIIRDFIKPTNDYKVKFIKNNFVNYVTKFNKEFNSQEKIINNTCDISTFYEFAIHTKYVDNWSNEIKEQYCWIEVIELLDILVKIGFRKVNIEYEYNSYLIKHICDNFELRDEIGNYVDLKMIFPTHIILVAFK